VSASPASADTAASPLLDDGHDLVVVNEQAGDLGGTERVLDAVLSRYPAARLVALRFGGGNVDGGDGIPWPNPATVVDAGRTVEMSRLSNDLADRGVERLMVEGGGTVHTQFLTADLVDELQLVVAPVFVGDSHAPRFVRDGCFPWNPARRATLAEVRQIGDVVLLRYALSPRFRIN